MTKKLSLFALMVMVFLASCLSVNAAEMSVNEAVSRIAVTGNVGKEAAGEKITMLLIKNDADPTDLQDGDIAWVEDTKVDADGDYSFRFKFGGLEFDQNGNVTNYSVYVKQGKQDITTTVKKATAVRDFTLVSLNITPGLTDVGASVKINNLFKLDNLSYRLMTASYDENGRMTGVVEHDTTTLGNDIETDSINVEIEDDTRMVKAFVWNDTENMIPLCKPNDFTSGDIVDYRITYPNFKNKAVTFSFDDGRIAFDQPVIDILDKYGLKGTFNLVSYSLSKGYIDKYAGHEAANHTSHDNMSAEGYTLEQCKNCITLGQNKIIGEFGEFARGLVWPYAAPKTRDDYTELVNWAKQQGYVYARDSSCSTSYHMPDKDDPDGWMYWRQTDYVANLFKTPERFQRFLDDPESEELLVYSVWTHAHEFWDNPAFTDADRPAQSSLSLENFDKFCKSVAENEDLWNTTNIGIYDYEQAAKNIVVGKDYIYNPSKTVTLYGFINGEKYVIAPESRAVKLDD